MSRIWMSRNYFKVTMFSAVVFAVAFLAFSVPIPVNDSNAAMTRLNANLAYGTYTVSLSVDSNVVLNAGADPTGVMTVSPSTITIDTSSPNGYKLYLGMNSVTNDLVHNVNNNLRITSSEGSFTNPAPLTTNGTWGYALSSEASNIATPNGFDETYAVGSSFAPNSNKFAAVPTNQEPAQLIISRNFASANADVIDVFYGVRASYETASGSYSNQVRYTMIADGGSNHDVYVSPEQSPSIDGGDTLTVTTTLFSNISGISGDVYFLTPAELANVHNNVPVSTYGDKKLTCTRDTSAPTLTLSCTSIAAPIGTYYIYVDVPDYGESYEKEFDYIANFYNITTMQEMTEDICKDARYVTTPSRLVMNGTNMDDNTSTAAYPANADLGTALYYPQYPRDDTKVPQTTLIDTRDSVFTENGEQVTRRVSYTVRKLADGNCWMTDNLELNWDTTRVFTSADTNVSSSKTASAVTQTLDGSIPTASDQEATDWVNANVDAWLSRSSNGLADAQGHGYGTYYNWYTATVSSVPYNWVGEYPGMSTEDICPKGWKLPEGGDDGSYMHLFREGYHLLEEFELVSLATNVADILRSYPFDFPYSGSISSATGLFDGRANESGTLHGRFWNGGVLSDVVAFQLGFENSVLETLRGDAKKNGFPVRCVVKPTH